MKQENSILFMLKVIIIIVPLAIGIGFNVALQFRDTSTIKVGILHSTTGSFATNEQHAIDLELLAIKEINEQGGLLGKLLEPVIADGQSNSLMYAQQAKKLITEDHVKVMFGAWSSASRKTTKEVVEKYNVLLFYPVQFEGLELSPNIIYVAVTPNQQILPATAWALKSFGKKIIFIGSDYIYPRSIAKIIEEYLTMQGDALTASFFVPLDAKDSDLEPIVEQIKVLQPDIMLNAVTDAAVPRFLRLLRNAGINPQTTSTVYFNLLQTDIRDLGADYFAGDYMAWSYFQNLPGLQNRKFLDNVFEEYGYYKVVTDPAETAYVGVKLWAQAVRQAESFDSDKVREVLKAQSLNAPEGVVYIDPETLHAWRNMRIAQINKDGQLSIVWNSQKPIPPKPYPAFKTQTEWDDFTDNLYKQWGNRWENPGEIES